MIPIGKADPAVWMNQIWEEELGSSRPISLTPKRRKKYRALFDEHLESAPDPELAFRIVLKAVKASEFHMATRSFQLPESLFVNAERRDRWVQDAVALVDSTQKKSTAAADFAAAFRQRQAMTRGGFPA